MGVMAGSIYYNKIFGQMMGEMVQQFRSITNDLAVSEQDIRKFLKWGKGNLEHALNYYYRQQDKKPKISEKKQQLENKPEKTISVQIKEEKRSSDVFSKMRTASVRQMNTEKFIKQVREEYQLPIKKGEAIRVRPSQEEKQKEEMIDEEVDQEFEDADYLPKVFSMKRQENFVSRQMVMEFRKRERDQDGAAQEVIQMDSMDCFDLNRSQNNERENEKEIRQEQFLQQEQIQKTKTLPLKEITSNKPSQNISKYEEESIHFGWATGESQIYLGETILSGFAIKFENNIQMKEGSHVQFRWFIEEDKKKKGFKSKKQSKVTNIRLLNRGSEFARLNDEESRILVPLLVHGMIRIELYVHTIPKRIDYYTRIKISTRVFLLKKAITEPVVQTFEGHSDLIVSTYKPVAEEILALFERLQVQIKRWPLIKRASKLSQKTTSKNTQMIASQTKHSDETERSKELERQQRMRNDPFFKSVQTNLSSMLKFQPKDKDNQNSNSQPVQEAGSAVKKKVLEYRTLDEDRCSQLIDLYEEDLEPYQPTKNFVSKLYHYQALALAWMIRREGDQQQPKQQDLHPLWTEYQLGQRSLFLNELTSQLSLKPPLSRSRCLGGILADEMGLGKTVMMAALVATTRSAKRAKREGGNLIVVPLTLLSQWQSQLHHHTRGLKTLIYYAQDRKKHEGDLQSFDAVITTYGTVSHQFAKGGHVSKSGLYRMRWSRIILDEAHYIKGRVIQTAKAVYELQASCRWCLTGTPIQNGLADLFSLLHFIRYAPWSEWQCWNKYILSPSESGDQSVFEVLRTILKRVFLRRTKQSRDHEGKCIVQLPPRSSKVELLQMNAKEREFYDSVYESSRLKIQELQNLGILQTKYMQVLEILMRLRQICNHPMLFKAIHKFTTDNTHFEKDLRRFVAKRAEEETGERYFQPLMEEDGEQQRVQVANSATSQAYLKQTLAKIESRELQNCVICLSEIQDPAITPCLHIFCRPCAVRQIEECGICSVCRRRLGRQDLLPLPRQNRFNQSLDSGFFPSTKLLALMDHLRRLAPGDKAVVFSQFLGMLDLIEHSLKAEKLTYVRMEGSTSHRQRTRIVDAFQRDPSVQVFVVSLKTAGVGLNLVAANRVFLVDPWWNPGVEEQAIERVHRIGQKRAVQIVRLVMDRSIETRMLELNSGKKQLSQRVLSQDLSAAESKVEKLKYLMAKY